VHKCLCQAGIPLVIKEESNKAKALDHD
jgi:hypothetical protein